MVADGHRVVAHQIHAAEVRLGILQIRLRNPGVNIAAREQQHAAAFCCHFFTNAVNQRFLRRQAILAIFTAPEVPVVIVGMQNGYLIRFILLISL